MNKLLLIFLLIFVTQAGFSQNDEAAGSGNGRRFLKIVENNYMNSAVIISSTGKKTGMYNVKSKIDEEQLFFGDINAMIEFFVMPSFESAYGFRIVRDSTDTSYILETKEISNWKEINSEMEKKFPSKSIPASQAISMSKEESEEIGRHNREMYYKQRTESLQLYSKGIVSKSFPVKDALVEKLYGTISSAIKDFVMKGSPAGIMDGYSVTFRCVVGDEVWSLTIHQPDGEMKQLTDFCQQLLKEL
ncbi:MAG: hypothetical protein LBT50_02205 [Prevotellaceae bacterium]|jgi:hypothetical protein|nr:hypothetical protein [Prevotellaceae bacterium]